MLLQTLISQWLNTRPF